MIRIIASAVGLVFAGVAFISLGFGFYAYLTDDPVKHLPYKQAPSIDYSFNGPLGKWDIAQLQRGYKVYKENCSACHSLKFVHFRDLAQLGYDEAQIKAEAASWTVPGIDPNTGEASTRPGRATDTFPSPFANNVAAAAANNNAIPPDLSLMTKARKNGTNYVAALLSGYADPDPAVLAEFPEAEPSTGLYHNPYFKNLNLAMAPPLVSEGQVTFDDGTKATVPQMSQDVAAFLTWTAEPSMIKRKQTGWAVVGFLIFATILAFLAKQQVWSSLKRKDD